MSFSRSGSCYASTAKLLNCLIGCVLMSTIAFAAIPHFVVRHSKGKIAAKSTKAGLNLAKIVAAKKNVDPGVIYGTQPYVYRTSNRRAVKVQVVSGRNHAASPVNFELRAKKNEKVQTP